MNEATVHVNALGAGIVELRLDRPPVNALNAAYLSAIERCALTLESDPDVRAVVLTAAGRSFSGGMDLKELLSFTKEDQRATVIALNITFARLYGLTKPLVAAAHGSAIAGGLFFVLASDYRVAAERALFGLAEMRVGVRFPIGPLEIARAELSATALRRLMLGGANHDATTALSLGVVDEVVATERVLERAVAVAVEYAALPGATFASIKRQIRNDVLRRIDEAIDADSDPMSAGWFTDETTDAVRAVLASLGT